MRQTGKEAKETEETVNNETIWVTAMKKGGKPLFLVLKVAVVFSLAPYLLLLKCFHNSAVWHCCFLVSQESLT